MGFFVLVDGIDACLCLRLLYLLYMIRDRCSREQPGLVTERNGK